MKHLKNSVGITIVALVVTIIIVLILAGVTLNLISGNDGLLNKTINATIQTQIAEIEEVANLIYTDLSMEKYIDEDTNKNIGIEDIVNQL